MYLAPRGQLGVDDEREVDAILFVRTAFTGVVEVIGKTGKIIESYVKDLQYENQGEKKVKNMPEEQEEAIQSIKYGGYTLKEIFSRNGAGENVYVSCKVEDLYVPTKTFFIAMSQEYANKAILRSNSEKIDENIHMYAELLRLALWALKDAYWLHNAMEAYYVPNMDFAQSNEQCDKTIAEIQQIIEKKSESDNT